MTTITIQVPGKAKTKLSAIVKEMGGEVISISNDKQAAKKERLLRQIKQGLIEAKKLQAGKAKSYSISDIFDDEY